MGSPVAAFLTHLAVAENVAASTQNQALPALLFLYRDVLNLELEIKSNSQTIHRKRPAGYRSEATH